MTSFPASVDSRSRPATSDGRPSAFVRSTTSVYECSDSGLIVTAGFPCQDISVAGKRTGLSGSRSSLVFALLGSLSKTTSIGGELGCPSCGAGCGDSGMPLCRFECEPQRLERSTIEPEGGWLPTPTASSYGSCRGGGAGRVGKWRLSLQSRGILHPEDWERLMGYPQRWTAIDATRSATPSCLGLPSLSFTESRK